jgi:hypothetical protein
LDHDHGKLRMASVSARWRRVVIPISWKAHGIVVFSVAAGLLALASASQSVIHTALICLILFAVGIGWLCLEGRFSDIWRVAWSLVLCGGIAFGLAGAAIVPMYMATGEMIRHIGGSAAVIGQRTFHGKTSILLSLN